MMKDVSETLFGGEKKARLYFIINFFKSLHFVPDV